MGGGQQLGAEENEALLFNGYRVPVLQDEKILEMECITMWMHLILLNCTFQNGYGIFYVYVYFTTIFKTNLNTKETLFHAKKLVHPNSASSSLCCFIVIVEKFQVKELVLS